MSNELFLEQLRTLQAVFGPLERPDELPKLVRECGALLVAWLYPAVSLEKRKETRRAVLCLYPIMGNVPVDAPLDDLDEEEPPLFPQTAAMLRFWAVLVSCEFRAIVKALQEDDLSSLDCFIDSGSLSKSDIDGYRRRFAEDTILMLHQAHKQMIDLEGTRPAKIMSPQEMSGIAEQRNKMNPEAPYYWQAMHLHIRINPNHDIESILAAVRKIVEDHHKSMKEQHHQNWSPAERDFYGDDHITACDPMKEFIFKESGSKSRSEQTFIDNAFHSLVIFSLRQTMKPVDIERRFFDMKEEDYNAATTRNDRHNVRAERLIGNALSGFPIHI